MIQKLKIALLPLLSLFIFAAPLAVSTSVGASGIDTSNFNIRNNVCSGTAGNLSTASGDSDCGKTNVSTFQNIVKWVLNILSIVVGIAAVIMIIVAGLKYVTSGGKEEGVKSAKNTILYAVIGLVIVALAQVIVHFVLNVTNNQVTGAS